MIINIVNSAYSVETHDENIRISYQKGIAATRRNSCAFAKV